MGNACSEICACGPSTEEPSNVEESCNRTNMSSEKASKGLLQVNRTSSTKNQPTISHQDLQIAENDPQLTHLSPSTKLPPSIRPSHTEVESFSQMSGTNNRPRSTLSENSQVEGEPQQVVVNTQEANGISESPARVSLESQPRLKRSQTYSPRFSPEVEVVIKTQFGDHKDVRGLDKDFKGSTAEVYAQITETKILAERYLHSPTEKLSIEQGTCVITGVSKDGKDLTPDQRPLESIDQWNDVEVIVENLEAEGFCQLKVEINRKLKKKEAIIPSYPRKATRSYLRSELRRCMNRSHNHLYLPKEHLEALTTKDMVNTALEDAGDLSIHINDEDGRRRFVNTICHGNQTLFAIFVYEQFPFQYLEKLITLSPNHQVDLPLPFEIPKWVGGLANDDDFKVEYADLYAKQWPFQAASFLMVGHYQVFNDNIIIPYHSKEYLTHGNFSTIYKVQFEQSHQKLYKLRENPNPELALKVLSRPKGMEQAFRNEQLILDGLQILNHAHIIKLLGTFCQGDVYHFLFPLAKQNLHSLLENEEPLDFSSPKSPKSKDFLAWVWSQMQGIASGLREIHDNTKESDQDDSLKNTVTTKFLDPNIAREERRKGTGYHHDIKPENILFFTQDGIEEMKSGVPEYGILQIADFGIGKFHSLQSGTGTGVFRGTITYAAPESKVPRRVTDVNDGSSSHKLKLSRPYDIWSFGCVLMEVLVWTMFGPNGRSQFTEARDGVAEEGDESNFNNAFFWLDTAREPHLRPTVEEWLKKLAYHDRIRSSPEGSLAKVFNLIQRVLVVDPETRPRAEEVVSDLSAVLKLARQEAREASEIGQQASVPGASDTIDFVPQPIVRVQTVRTVDEQLKQAPGNSPKSSMWQRVAALPQRPLSPGLSSSSYTSPPRTQDAVPARADTFGTLKSDNSISSSTVVQHSDSRDDLNR